MAIDNPWGELPKRPPYVLPMDRAGVEAHERRLRGLGSAAQENFRLHTELLPTPFLGNPAAPLVLLNLNPGFSEQDEADYALPAFGRAATLNLTHEVEDTPFFTIDSSLPATSSYKWWRSRLRGPIEAAGESVGRNLFCVQAFPYHSSGFDTWLWDPPSKLYELFPSQRYTVQLLSEAIGRGALIVGLRSGREARRYWQSSVPELASVLWLQTRTGSAPRSPYVTENALGPEGWRELVRRLRD